MTKNKKLYYNRALLFYAPNFEKVGDILVSACPCVCVGGGGGGGGIEISS